MIRVVVTDRDPQVRVHLAAVIDAHPEMEVVATAGTADDACRAVAEHGPDVAIVDPRLRIDGADLADLLGAIRPETRCLIHSTGADGGHHGVKPDATTPVVFKQLQPDRLLAAIARLAAPPASAGGVEPPDTHLPA